MLALFLTGAALAADLPAWVDLPPGVTKTDLQLYDYDVVEIG